MLPVLGLDFYAKPDIKYKRNSRFHLLTGNSAEILGSVCQTLRKGGIITYSTCTIVSEENFQVVEAFLEKSSRVRAG